LVSTKGRERRELKINEVISDGSKNPSEDPEALSNFIDKLVLADDFDANSRGFFCAGYMSGMAHALSIINKTGDPRDVIGEILYKESMWNGVGLD